MFKKLPLLLLAAICLAAVIINGCKKDAHTQQQDKISDPAIAKARNWYESTYPTDGKLSTQATTGSKDLSQVIKPDWQHTATYSRFNNQVIEMPIDPSVNFASAIKNKQTGQATNKTYSKSSYILLNNGTGYDAYVMTLIADSAYLKSDPAKLARNTYSKREADFSGLVLYFTPNGKYVGGYRYKDGHLVVPGTEAATPKVQSTGNSRLSPNNMEPTEDCTDWFWVTFENGVPIDYQYMYTTCATAGQGGGGNEPPPAGGNPCPQGTHSVKGLIINNMPPPPPPGGGDDGGGFPSPPTNPQPSPCSVPATITNNVKDPCLRNMVNAAISSDITYSLNQSMVSIFNSNTDFNLNFKDAVASTFNPQTVDGTTDVDYVHFTTVSSSRKVIDAMDITITLNQTGLGNASQEYITATIMHEAFHAYLTSSQTIINQHIDMAQNYISIMEAQLIKLYPNLSPEDAKALTWGGLEKDAASLFSQLSDVEKNNISIANKNYKSGKSGQPCIH